MKQGEGEERGRRCGRKLNLYSDLDCGYRGWRGSWEGGGRAGWEEVARWVSVGCCVVVDDGRRVAYWLGFFCSWSAFSS